MRPFKRHIREKHLRVNKRIWAPEVRVIDDEGKQLGILKTDEALRIAYERRVDLIEIVPGARPPVCKLADYGKYKYEEKKKRHKHKPKVMKEIKLRLNIQDADKAVKLKQAEKFLAHGHKVFVRLWFRGREIIYGKRGKEILWDFGKALESVAVIEQPPKVERRTGTLLLTPKTTKDGKIENKEDDKIKNEEGGEKKI